MNSVIIEAVSLFVTMLPDFYISLVCKLDCLVPSQKDHVIYLRLFNYTFYVTKNICDVNIYSVSQKEVYSMT